MVDVAQLEESFRDWRRAQAAQEDIFLQTAIIIANYVNAHDLPTIQQELVLGSVEFNAFDLDQNSIYSRLGGTLAYIKLVTDDYLSDEDISDEDRTSLAKVQSTLDALYGKISALANPRTTLLQKPGIFRGTNPLLDLLSTDTGLWVDTYAQQSHNPIKSQELCRSLYTVITILKLGLDEIPPSVGTLLRLATINIELRKGQLTQLLGQIATKIEEFPIVAPMLDLDAAEDEEDAPLDLEEEAPPPADNVPPTADNVPTPAENEEDEYFDLTTPAEYEEDEYFDLPTPITLREHFDAQALTILSAEEHNLPEKIRRIQGALELTNTGLTQLIEQKNSRNELITQQSPARTIIDAIAENNDRRTGKQSASDLIRANQPSVDELLRQIPEDELAAWEALQIQLAPAPRNGVFTAAANLYRRLPESAQERINVYFVPASEDQLAVALDNLAKRQFRALRGEREAAERLMDTTINQLAGNTHPAKELLKNATITELQRLSRINQAAQGVITEYARLVNHIVTTQQKLRDANGLDVHLDAFIVNYNSILVTISLFLSHYLGSFFKTDTADKIDKARTMKNNVRQWKEDYEAELQRDINDISSNPRISTSVKTAFVESVNSLRTAPNLPVIALTAAGADLPAEIADHPAEVAGLPVVVEPIAIVQPQTTKIGRDFELVQTLFNRLTPPPPPVEQVDPAPPIRGIVM